MNKVTLIGRLTKDPEMRYTEVRDEQKAIARFTLAVNRRYNREREQQADFISCVAFGKTAEFIEKYFSKGLKIAAVGRIRTGNYTNKDGVKIYTTDIVLEEVEFAESKAASDDSEYQSETSEDGFMSVPEDVDDMLPF